MREKQHISVELHNLAMNCQNLILAREAVMLHYDVRMVNLVSVFVDPSKTPSPICDHPHLTRWRINEDPFNGSIFTKNPDYPAIFALWIWRPFHGTSWAPNVD